MNSRIFHLDTLRAFAIIMMLQGHFVDSLLDVSFRDPDNLLYSSWLFCRGFTAPLFFTVTGLVITYLLFRNPDPAKQNARVTKTLKRGVKLILWGYLLNTNIFSILTGHFSSGFFSVNVLHCLGVGLILIVGLFLAIGQENKHFFQNILLLLGLLFFIFEPAVSTYPFSIENPLIFGFISKASGSVFTPLPWLGYTFIGGFLGIMYVRFYNSKKGSLIMMATLVIIGGFMVFFSSRLFMNLSIFFNEKLFKSIAYNNYLFIRLGYVFIIIAVFFTFERYLSKVPSLNKIGQNTLNIYLIHYILLYGSFFGLGLTSFFYRSLNPSMVITGAIFFVTINIWLAKKAQKTTIKQVLLTIWQTLPLVTLKLRKITKRSRKT
jgi:uncharacterized membrane protein